MSKVIRVQGAVWGKSFCQLSVIFINNVQRVACSPIDYRWHGCICQPGSLMSNPPSRCQPAKKSHPTTESSFLWEHPQPPNRYSPVRSDGLACQQFLHVFSQGGLAPAF